MSSIHDVSELCSDEEKLQKWLLSCNVLQPMAAKRGKCGSDVKEYDRRGKPGRVCCNQKCRARASGQAGSIQEQCKLTEDHGLTLRIVDHNKGVYSRREFVRGKMRVVTTNGIDGTWGRLKNWSRGKGGVDGGNSVKSAIFCGRQLL